MTDNLLKQLDYAVDTLLEARMEVEQLSRYIAQLEDTNEDMAYQILDLEEGHTEIIDDDGYGE